MNRGRGLRDADQVRGELILGWMGGVRLVYFSSRADMEAANVNLYTDQ